MKKLLFFVSCIVSSLANAGDVNCQGTVRYVMDYPQHCNGNMAFMTTGTAGKWVCTPSDNGNSIVLAAIAAGKTVKVYIDSQNDTLTCSSLPNYVKARYVIISP